MRNYFLHMNFNDLVAELQSVQDLRARQLMLIAANVVGPNEIEFPDNLAAITEEHLQFAEEFLCSEAFRAKFQQICQMDTIPEVSLAQMKTIKGKLMEELITSELGEELGNAARLLTSWLDGILEFTILKHEVIVLRLKN